MEKDEKKKLDFVLRYYQSGKLDTQKALCEIKKRNHRAVERRLWRYVSMAAALLILVIGGVTYLLRDKQTVLKSGETTVVYLLPDSSRVTLAPHSTLSYATTDCRNVQMSGRVYFEVRRDIARPFSVNDRIGCVRVLGTKFEVDEKAQATSVLVNEGKVLFTARSTTDGLFLTRGMSGTLYRGARRPELNRRSDINRTAWATHQFHFRNTPLSEVLRTLSAYYGVSLTTDQSQKRLTADFQTERLDKLVRIIEHTLEVEIRSFPSP